MLAITIDEVPDGDAQRGAYTAFGVEIDPRQRQLCRGDAAQKHGIGLGEMRLDADAQRRGEQGGAQERGFASDQPPARGWK